jgi:two-component system, sensor histidine kinase and response regulator
VRRVCVSHELRNPLHAIVGMNELMVGTPLTSKQREFVESIACCSNIMCAIVNDVLDLSRIEAGKLELEHIPFDLRRLISDIEQVYKFM